VRRLLLCAVSQLLLAALPRWREAALEQHVSLSKLEKLDWRVDIVSAGSSVAAMSTPVVIMDCAIRDPPRAEDSMPSTRHVMVELDHASLGALLDGMRRIRDQLAVALPQ
jgi:hypothetical protein